MDKRQGTHNKRIEVDEGLKIKIPSFLWGIAFLYILPAIVALLYNFIRSLIAEDWAINKFDWKLFSYPYVISFYAKIWSWIKR